MPNPLFERIAALPALAPDKVCYAPLRIVGLGTGGIGRLSIEAALAMDSCSRIYHISPVGTELRLIYGDRAISLEDLYSSSPTPAVSYGRIVEFLATEARKAAINGQSICFASYGDALFMVDSATELLETMKHDGIMTSIVPGLSSISALRAMFPAVLRSDFQCVLAGSVASGAVALNPAIPTILTQIAEVEVSELRSPVSKSGLQKLSQALATTFGSDWACHLAVAPWAPHVSPLVIDTTCARLSRHADQVFTGMSLVLAGRPRD